MKINKIEINNFYSIKKVALNFDNFKGLVLIKGKNRDTNGSNGSGKSVLLEGVVWGLFGKTIRKSTEAALINLYTKKNCSVRITLNNNVVIERGKKPTYLRFYVGDKEMTQDNALNTQHLIEEHLNTNYKIFLASSIFGQQNKIEFISATPEDKRTIIKNFLNLDSLFDLRSSVKYLKSEYSQGMKECSVRMDELEKNNRSFNDKIKTLSILKEQVEGKYDQKILALDLNDILKIESDNSACMWQVSGINKEIEALEDRISHLIEKVNNPDTVEVCDKCGQNVHLPLNPRTIITNVKEFREQVDHYEKKKEDILSQVKEVPISSSEYHKILEYKDLCKESETFEDLKEETKDKIEAAHSNKQEYYNKYEVMKFWEKAFSESGLVKYIIRNILKYFNGKTNFYLSHLSKGKFFIEFDEELQEKVLHNGKEISYISLSGGEKRKVGLAVMLGLQQLLTLSHKEESNLMFFDEVAENLDQDGLDGLYILLSELKKNKSLFVITHNNYLKSLMDNVRTLTITKSKGISSITGQ